MSARRVAIRRHGDPALFGQTRDRQHHDGGRAESSSTSCPIAGPVPPPSLPAEVIRELSERARLAERALRAQLCGQCRQEETAGGVRASVQPTFVRFVFEMPDGINVSSVLNDQKLTLQFNNVLNFDLATPRSRRRRMSPRSPSAPMWILPRSISS